MGREGAAAVNASPYFDDGSSSAKVGSVPAGMVVRNGKIVWNDQKALSDSGFVGFNRDHILIMASAMNPEQASELGIRDGCSGGPVLIVNNQPNADVYNENYGYDRRTAIGQCSDGSVIFVCADGRTADSIGADYRDMIDILMEYGAVNACALYSSEGTAMLSRNSDTGEIEMLTSFPFNRIETPRMPTFRMVRSGK